MKIVLENLSNEELVQLIEKSDGEQLDTLLKELKDRTLDEKQKEKMIEASIKRADKAVDNIIEIMKKGKYENL